MSNTFRTLDHADVKGKRVLMRVDLNVPYENGVVSDATRIERIAPSITELADKGAKVILLSHFGRPKGRDASQSLKPVAAEVAHTIKRPIKFVGDCIGDEAERAVRPTASGRVTLVQEAGRPSPGFLIYMPVFDQVSEARRLKGFLYSPFNASDFLASALQLEARYDADEPRLFPEDAPRLVEEVERFLRDQD